MFLNLHKKIVGWFVSLEQDCIFRQLWSSRHTDDPVAELKEKKEDLLVDDQSQGSPFLVWLATYHLSYYLGPSDNWAPIDRPVEIVWRLLLSVWYLFLIILCHLPWCSPWSQSWCWWAQSWWSSLRCWSRPRWRSPHSECRMPQSRYLTSSWRCWGYSGNNIL